MVPYGGRPLAATPSLAADAWELCTRGRHSRRWTAARRQETDPVTWHPELEELRERQKLARRMGGADKVKRQHDGGRLTVRERIDGMLDPDSFFEIGSVTGAEIGRAHV